MQFSIPRDFRRSINWRRARKRHVLHIPNAPAWQRQEVLNHQHRLISIQLQLWVRLVSKEKRCDKCTGLDTIVIRHHFRIESSWLLLPNTPTDQQYNDRWKLLDTTEAVIRAEHIQVGRASWSEVSQGSSQPQRWYSREHCQWRLNRHASWESLPITTIGIEPGQTTV